MGIDPDLAAQISRLFAPLNKQAAANAFPSPTSLSNALSSLSGSASKNVSPAIATMFTTAGVSAWMSGVHSFLVSAALTEASPLWACVAGYYSSHYSIRGIAHLLGFFQLFSQHRNVKLEFLGGRNVCVFTRKRGDDREHRFYWKVVKANPHFVDNPLFTANPMRDESDVANRDRANYADHLPHPPPFRPLSEPALKARINKISELELASPPIPRASKCPDLEAVQIVAYHRLVAFRDLVDAAIGGQNRFWNVYRQPSWTKGLVDFQLTDKPGLPRFTV